MNGFTKRTRYPVLILLLLSIIATLGCQGENSSKKASSDGKGGLQGQVTMPLEGARLYVYKPGMDLYGPAFAISKATGSDGRFELELPDGDYVVVARKRAGGGESGPVVAGDNRSEFITIKVSDTRFLAL